MFEDYHELKLMPLLLIPKYAGNILFHDNVNIRQNQISKCTFYCQVIVVKWINNFTSIPRVLSVVLAEYIWV